MEFAAKVEEPYGGVVDLDRRCRSEEFGSRLFQSDRADSSTDSLADRIGQSTGGKDLDSNTSRFPFHTDF